MNLQVGQVSHDTLVSLVIFQTVQIGPPRRVKVSKYQTILRGLASLRLIILARLTYFSLREMMPMTCQQVKFVRFLNSTALISEFASCLRPNPLSANARKATVSAQIADIKLRLYFRCFILKKSDWITYSNCWGSFQATSQQSSNSFCIASRHTLTISTQMALVSFGRINKCLCIWNLQAFQRIVLRPWWTFLW